MLEWMQKHKKYLVITVWISALALIFAGLVEWGGGGFSSISKDYIAKVKNHDISRQEYENVYFNIYNSLKHFFDNDERIRIPEIEEEAFRQVVQKKMLEVLAEEIGVNVPIEESIARLITIPEFLNNKNEFDKEYYLEILKANNRKPEDFEMLVTKEILLEKMQNFPLFPVSTLEINAFLSAGKIRDNIALKVIDKSSILKNKVIELSESAIETFWEQHQNTYYQPANYKIAYIALDFSDIEINDEILTKFYNENANQYSEGALERERDILIEDYKKSYTKIIFTYLNNIRDSLQSRNNSSQVFSNVLTSLDRNSLAILSHYLYDEKQIVPEIPINFANLSENDIAMYPKLLEQISNGEELLPPIEYNNGVWIVPYVLEKQPKIQLTFDQAKELVQKDAYKQQEDKEFRKIAESQLHNLDTNTLTDIGFIGIPNSSMQLHNNEEYRKIEKMGLTDSEIRQLFTQIMTTHKKDGVVFIDNQKAIFYHIKQQSMPNYNELINASNNEINEIEEYKNRDLRNALFEYTINRYKIIDYRR